jgi:hypothetical protein
MKHSNMPMKLRTLSSLVALAVIAAPAQSQSQAPGLIVPGRIGGAMKFDGARYVRPPGLGTFEKGTISIWIRPEKNP